THKGSLAERFAGARQIYSQQILEDIFSFNDLTILAIKLLNEVNAQKDKLNKEAVEWILQIKDQWFKEKMVGEKFLSQVAFLMKDQPVIEQNQELIKRIKAASEYFQPRLQNLIKDLQKQPIITEHREAAGTINETLNQLFNEVHLRNYYLQYCKNPFSITSFLQEKLKYIQPKITLSCYAISKSSVATDVDNGELYNTLVRWRNMACEENNMPIYMVANSKSLREIATFLPMDKKDLLKISGFGKARVDKFGDDIIDTVKDYCEMYHLDTNMSEKELNPKRVRSEKPKEDKIPSNLVSFNLFKEGKSIEQIAKERNFAISTIEGHLSRFVTTGELDINDIVTKEKQDIIKKAAKAHGNEHYSVLREKLPNNISYNEIRLVMAMEKVD
ncbi:MAG: helix-turn-helix domain-containing protein, partial [Ginsengibacter sp.]